MLLKQHTELSKMGTIKLWYKIKLIYEFINDQYRFDVDVDVNSSFKWIEFWYLNG